jgi:aryl-alcohol dehydrogenase-like predicted oxidoreductase
VIARHAFGATGHESSRVIFGAAALSSVSQAEADAALPLLLEHGVNHIDTAASYGDSELRLAPWLRDHGSAFFLATKTGERGYAAAREEIRRSLDRLGVDHVDLLQLHNLVHPAEWDLAMGEDGSLRAAVEARDEGLVRFIGVTGHGLTVAEMHLRSLSRFPFDSVLFPYSHVIVQDPGGALGARRGGRVPQQRRRPRVAAAGARGGGAVRASPGRRRHGRACRRSRDEFAVRLASRHLRVRA